MTTPISSSELRSLTLEAVGEAVLEGFRLSGGPEPAGRPSGPAAGHRRVHPDPRVEQMLRYAEETVRKFSDEDGVATVEGGVIRVLVGIIMDGVTDPADAQGGA